MTLHTTAAIVFCAAACLFAIRMARASAPNTTKQTTRFFKNVVFSPPRIEQLVEGREASVHVYQRANTTTAAATIGRVLFRATLHDTSVAEIVANVSETELENDMLRNDSGNGFKIRARLLGRTFITFYAKSSSYYEEAVLTYDAHMIPHPVSVTNNTWTEVQEKYFVSVIRKQSVVDKVFIILLSVIVVGINIGMGCAIDLGVVRGVLRRPVAPAIGLCSQFIFMPVVAFGIVRLLGVRGGRALGFLATGCVPGGGQSNMYTLLLRGDVSLSVTMTLVSVLASLAMMPLWLLTLGQLLMEEDTDVQIPFQRIIISLMAIIVPLSIGILIGRVRPALAHKIGRLLKPILFILAPFMIAIGFYTNMFIFRLITPYFILAGCSLPYLGFLFGGIISTLCRQPLRRIIAITIETGIQNIGIAIMVLKYSLPQPEADLAMVGPVAVAILTPLPLWLAITLLEIHKRCCRKEDREKTSTAQAQEVEDLLSENTASTTTTTTTNELKENEIQTTTN